MNTITVCSSFMERNDSNEPVLMWWINKLRFCNA